MLWKIFWLPLDQMDLKGFGNAKSYFYFFLLFIVLHFFLFMVELSEHVSFVNQAYYVTLVTAL